ncbi:MAG: hypothetical protein HY097_10675 [Nitrospinae bacterium]|nr:hypothetical protein [Nitrospinota bacterium]MBI3813600.1 hypothetical protein [Nitrospinota bacterium]
MPNKPKGVISIILAIILFSIVSNAHAVEVAPKISDREIIEGLADIRGDIKEIRADIKRLEAEVKGEIKEIRAEIKGLQHQIADLKDSTNKQFDSTNKQFDSTNRQIADLKDFMLWGFGILFAGMFTLIGFVLWDRRSALSPAIKKNKELEEREDKVERVLKEYAHKEPRLAEILRSVGIM